MCSDKVRQISLDALEYSAFAARCSGDSPCLFTTKPLSGNVHLEHANCSKFASPKMLEVYERKKC